MSAIILRQFSALMVAVLMLSAPSYTILLTASQPKAKLGSPIVLHTSLTNVTDKMILVRNMIGFDQAETNYAISIKDEAGNIPNFTPYGLEMKDGPQLIAGVDMKRLQPGESIEQELDLNQLYVFTKPGKYFVVVSRHGDDTIKSNTLEITLTQ